MPFGTLRCRSRACQRGLYISGDASTSLYLRTITHCCPSDVTVSPVTVHRRQSYHSAAVSVSRLPSVRRGPSRRDFSTLFYGLARHNILDGSDSRTARQNDFPIFKSPLPAFLPSSVTRERWSVSSRKLPRETVTRRHGIQKYGLMNAPRQMYDRRGRDTIAFASPGASVAEVRPGEKNNSARSSLDCNAVAIS